MNPAVTALRAELQEACAVVARRLAEAEGAALGTPAERAFVALALHHAYVALEAWIERAVRFFDEDVPSGPAAHRALLNRAGLALPAIRPALLSSAALVSARELLKFRHFLHHDYGAELESEPLAALQRHALTLRTHLPAEFEAFDAWLAEVATARG